MSSISRIPEYLLGDVLARLPTKSLLQIRGVSKSWCDMIDSQEFIKMHLNRCALDGQGQRIVWSQYVNSWQSIMNKKIWKLYSAEFDSPGKFGSTAVEVNYPFWRFNVGKSSVVGSCNGLICVDNDKFGLCLWNLSIRKQWELPKEAIGTDFSNRRHVEICYGFGYDDSSDDYKVVTMVGVKHKRSRPKSYEVKIYSLKLNSWKQLPDFPFTICESKKNGESGVLANCSLHWIVGEEESQKGGRIYASCIAAIDLRTEEYKFLQLPEFSKDLPWNFAALDGCLSMVCCNREDPDDPDMVQMWVMKEYGKEDSWSKLTLDIPVDNRYPTLLPIAYSDSNRNKLLFETGLEKVLWYDIEAETSQHLQIYGSHSMVTVYPYASSLVQPCRGRSKEIKQSNKWSCEWWHK